MRNHVGVVLIAGLLSAGCHRPVVMMGPPQKPAQPEEIKPLEFLIGSWNDYAQLLSPAPPSPGDTGAPAQPDQNQPTGFAKTDWAIGGMAIMSNGWYEMGEGNRVNFTEYWMWDPRGCKYRTSYFDDWGNFGSGSAVRCEDGNTFCIEGRGSGLLGFKTAYTGRMRPLDADTIEWMFEERGGPMGDIAAQGVHRRQK